MQDEVADKIVDEREFQLRKLEEIRAALDEARKTGDWGGVPDEVYRDYLKKIVLSSAPTLANYLDFKEVDFVSAEHVYLLDLPPMNTDPLQTTDHSATEYQLEQANHSVFNKLRAKALAMNADAVISVDIKHVLLDTDAMQKRFVVIATGTAVRIE